MSNLDTLKDTPFAWSGNSEAFEYESNIEQKYQECLDDALNGKHSINADDTHLQNAVARLVAIELKLNPRLLSLDSNPDTLARIGYQVALLVQRELTECAKFYEEAA